MLCEADYRDEQLDFPLWPNTSRLRPCARPPISWPKPPLEIRFIDVRNAVETRHFSTQPRRTAEIVLTVRQDSARNWYPMFADDPVRADMQH